MSGYNWQCGMSNNAVEARLEGRVPATAVAEILRKRHGIAGCTAADVRTVLPPCEWHHTSKWFNRTDFFDSELVDAEQLAKLRTEIAFRKAFAAIRRHNASDTIRTSAGKEWYSLRFGCHRVIDAFRLAIQCVEGHGDIGEINNRQEWSISNAAQKRMVIRAARNIRMGRPAITLRK